jgi:hypothetical protein
MTAAAITKELEQQTIIHETARQIVELLDQAAQKVATLGGSADEARERMIELVTE